jgi:hypothetical protein
MYEVVWKLCALLFHNRQWNRYCKQSSTSYETRYANSAVCLATTVTQEFIHILECWPNTTAAWAGWRRFDIPLDRYDGVHSLLRCYWGLLPATRPARRKVLIEQNINRQTGPALCVFSFLGCNPPPPHTHFPSYTEQWSSYKWYARKKTSPNLQM